MPLSATLKIAGYVAFYLLIISISAFLTAHFLSGNGFVVGAIVVFLLLPGVWYLYLISPAFDFSPDLVLRDREKTVALTFDDGPTPGFTDGVLDILHTFGVKATFFVIGKKLDTQGCLLVKRMLREGHEVGGHTVHHRKLHLLSLSEIEKEIAPVTKMVNGLYEETGVQNVKLFRAPHGFKSSRLKRYLKRSGLRLVPWTRGVWDTALPGSPWIFKHATESPKPNEIVLLHDGLGMVNPGEKQKNDLVEALPQVIRFYREAGYEFVPVSKFVKPDEK
jgi:peptidoglycan/xylan/chitin deacetylase (PgdA/CDA1 family)